jgi:hypothetical protein
MKVQKLLSSRLIVPALLIPHCFVFASVTGGNPPAYKAGDDKGVRFGSGISFVQPIGNSSLLGSGFGPFLTAEKHLTDEHALRAILGYTHFTEGQEHFGAELHGKKANRLDFGVHWVYYLSTNTRGPFVFGGVGVLNEIGTFTRSDIDGNLLYSTNYDHFSPVMTVGAGYFVRRHTFEISFSLSEADSYTDKFRNGGLSTVMNPNKVLRQMAIEPNPYRPASQYSLPPHSVTKSAGPLPIVDPIYGVIR